ncbi:MAG: DUF4442 domain-containing protein [Chitinophagaceae bacterium]
MSGIAAFARMVKHPLKFRLFLLSRLPSAFFAGVRVRHMDEQSCEVTVPYKWFSQNPFRSTYFACLAMAAEMSTGTLAMAYTYKRRPAVSMLVVNIYGEYYKKATGRTRFVCQDGELFRAAIEEAVTSGEARTVKARSAGRNEAGETVAEFFITWSFKARKT